MGGPSLAENARTAVASARTGALTTYPRGARPLLTNVRVRDDDGSVEFAVNDASAAAGILLVRPLATMRLAPSGAQLTTLHGTVRRVPAPPGSRLARFALHVEAIRVGHRCGEPVDPEDYRAAEPDPLREDAPAILAHLRRDHGRDLTGCLRAQGHRRVWWAEARRLDRYGLELSILDDDGVGTVRLDFPAPVRCLDELGPGLSLALRGRCGDCRPPQDGSE